MNAPAQFPLARNPGGPVPVRRAHSVRRTSTIDTGWPDGWGKPMLMLGHARDVRTGAAGSAPELLDEAQFRILATQAREIVEIGTKPAHPAAAKLVGIRAGGQSRAALAEHMAADKAAGTPLYLLLDDFAGASLVTGWIWSQWNDGWHDMVAEARGGLMSEMRQRMTNICTGFAEGSSAFDSYQKTHNRPEDAEVPSLLHPDDPDGWHALVDHPKVSMRRARWIDVWREDGMVRAEIGFQDSGTNPRGSRSAVHEYRLLAQLEADGDTLAALQVTPHILPFRECPGAVANAQRMVGQRLSDFRQTVLETLPGTAGCTHLNDVLRSMAEIPHLATALTGGLR